MSKELTYVEWLEQVVAKYQPDWICDELACGDGWCYENCKSDWNGECLKRFYKKQMEEVRKNLKQKEKHNEIQKAT